MQPPQCPITGKHLRWLVLAGVLSYFIYFLVHGIQEPPSSRAVYLCDTEDVAEMIECQSLDDFTTCAELTDVNGNVASCIESSCGYRLFPHIDISIAGTSDPFDPSAGTSTTSFFSVMSVFYGLVPYLMGFVYIILFLATGDITPFTRLLVLGVIAIMNDGIFKNILQQHRPEGSCLYFLSFGMPSGHAATSIGLLTYLLLEIFVYHPNLLCGLTCQKKEQQNTYPFAWGYGWQRPYDAEEQSTSANQTSGAGNSVAIDINDDGEQGGDANGKEPTTMGEPNASAEEPLLQSSGRSYQEKWRYHWIALGYFLLLFPVPFSRVYLHDHLRQQVLAGSAIGIVASMIWYLGFVRFCGMRIIEHRKGEWGQWWGFKFGWEEGFL